MKSLLALTLATTFTIVACAFAEDKTPRTTFQIHAPWSPLRDLQSDGAMIYGMDGTTADRIKSYHDQGYVTEFMTGAAWGNYADYVEGKFDGTNHMDDAQVRRDGTKVMHDPSTPYFVPSLTYRAYLKTKLAAAIDAGATAIYMEEPEFWAFAGYEESFKREYKKFYHEDWQPPHESIDARFRVDHLKYIMYRDELDDLFHFSKDYAAKKHKTVRCYVPTHSLISYAQIRMVSPMSSLMNLKDCDGYIAQVWTGTARHPNTYQGITKERTFEAAYFEYAQMAAMVRPTKHVCYFLADPMEDDRNHGWDDYEANYKRTLVASLMQPEINHYEIAPWPNRVFEADYYATEKDARRAQDEKGAGPSPSRSSLPPQRIPIPKTYATTLQICFNALSEMPAESTPKWDTATPSVGILVSDTMMFERDDPTPSDPHLNNFFGLALPFLKNGIPARVVQLETLPTPYALKGIDVLFMTYEGMKPLDATYHTLIANWVRAGGALVMVDDQADPYNKMRAWWNTAPNAFATPLAHLLKQLGMSNDETSVAVGKGHVIIANDSPAKLAYDAEGSHRILSLLDQALATQDQGRPNSQSNLVLHRGEYVIAANVDESPNAKPATIPGRYVDLFDATLPVVNDPTLNIGEVKLYREIGDTPVVLASASRIRNFAIKDATTKFESRGPEGIHCITRIRLTNKPQQITIIDNGKPVAHQDQWDNDSSTLRLEYENNAHVLQVTIQ